MYQYPSSPALMWDDSEGHVLCSLLEFPSHLGPERKTRLSVAPVWGTLPFLYHISKPLLMFPGVISQINDSRRRLGVSICFQGNLSKTITFYGRRNLEPTLRVKCWEMLILTSWCFLRIFQSPGDSGLRDRSWVQQLCPALRAQFCPDFFYLTS